MKKPLLFCLVLWVVLLVLPWTHGRALLDWRGATIEQLSGDKPEWAPLDVVYAPEQDMYSITNPQEEATPVPDVVKVGELRVAPQFAAIARDSSDRDVLVWCALSATDPKDSAHNIVVLERRFPNNPMMLAWKCGAQMQNLNMTTRVSGPLTSPFSYWSVQRAMQTPGYEAFKIAPKDKPQWAAMLADIHRGQKMESNNGFWWWMEAMALLGARRDEEVWSVLKAGSSKPEYNDYSKDKMMALRSAHLKTQWTIPVIYLVNGDATRGSYIFYSRWREVARQVCENIMGARLAGRDKVAIEGGRDLMLMGSLVRRSGDDISTLVGIAIEAITLQNAILPSATTTKRLATGASVQAFAGHPRSLLRYANELNRKDIALQISKEWAAVGKARRTVAAKTKGALASGTRFVDGLNDTTVAWAAGSQNTGALLVQTLPIPLLMLAVLSLLLLRARKRDEAFTLPTWKRGLGWSAFALVVLLAGQALFAQLVWDSMGISYPGFDFMLPRMLLTLPLWAFAFATCVAFAGAVWGTVVASRRARGDASMWESLKGLLSTTDERTGTLNLTPILQLIAIMGMWGLFIGALGAWFYYPQEGVISRQETETWHTQYPAGALALFCLAAIIPALFFRDRNRRIGTYFWSWLRVGQRFLVAHVVVATVLYLLIAINGAFWAARFDAEWVKANTPRTGKVGG
ncbi:hypothetical protein EON83_25260 [bacterium]|nr:MAG: hypothetical protein EON83_25260 [bacterium]